MCRFILVSILGAQQPGEMGVCRHQHSPCYVPHFLHALTQGHVTTQGKDEHHLLMAVGGWGKTACSPQNKHYQDVAQIASIFSPNESSFRI